MTNTKIQANCLDFGHVGWKYYNQIRKKAMEQEFSWSGFLISLSIVFFIVIFSSFVLSFLYQSMEQTRTRNLFLYEKTYYLENLSDRSLENYLQVEYINVENVKKTQRLNNIC